MVNTVLREIAEQFKEIRVRAVEGKESTQEEERKEKKWTMERRKKEDEEKLLEKEQLVEELTQEEERRRQTPEDKRQRPRGVAFIDPVCVGAGTFSSSFTQHHSSGCSSSTAPNITSTLISDPISPNLVLCLPPTSSLGGRPV